MNVFARLAARCFLFVASGVVFLVGLWIVAGKLTDDFRAAMGLTAVWYGAAVIAALVAVRRWRRRAVPVLLGVLLAVVGSGAYLAWATLRDRVVDERVASAAPGTGNTRVAVGSFVSGEHATSGRAAVIRLRNGELRLALLDLDTSPGPDLRVYLARPGDVSEHVDLGGLKGNKGTQEYAVPRGTDLRALSAAVIWCRAFSVEFGRAQLRSTLAAAAGGAGRSASEGGAS